ncbi:Protoheme IX farnesyltransferase [Bienertia sinuspersici]
MNHRGIDDRKQPSYLAGVDEFLNVAFSCREDFYEVRCPCLKCNHDRITIKSHLIAWGIALLETTILGCIMGRKMTNLVLVVKVIMSLQMRRMILFPIKI